MAKNIRITQENINEVLKDFAAMLQKTKMSDGKVNYTKSFGAIDRKAKLKFTEMAWIKMTSLVREFDKEIAWHGVAYRGAQESDEYIITDILVYPQYVTGVTVNEDVERSSHWSMKLSDEVFNNMRMQGHSHVNMSVSPSGTDTDLYAKFLNQCGDKDFYIFLIWNKRGDKMIKIYDFEKNVLFETADCTVEIIPDGTGIEEFLKNAKEMVKDKVYRPTPIGSALTKPEQKETKPDTEKKQETTQVKVTEKKKRKGKRKDKSNTTSETDHRTWDDDDYPYYGEYGLYLHDRFYNW